ncbi:MAG: DJ-1/PfpI family protein, partial [Lachnospiraceae bacterium]|nr:DJ-1/PfpI family protein [Lachnospiraceae bacterium]
AMEGYSINADRPLEEVKLSDVRSFIVPGGEIANIDDAVVMDTIRRLHKENVLIAGICAGVDVLDKAGILKDIRSTCTDTQRDCVKDGNVITARANAYVDFAIEAAKALDLFEDEADLQETISFWKNHQRV